jgi:hypothetical protein
VRSWRRILRIHAFWPFYRYNWISKIFQRFKTTDKLEKAQVSINLIFKWYPRGMAAPFLTANRKFIYRRRIPCFCSVKARHCRTPQQRRYARCNLFPNVS